MAHIQKRFSQLLLLFLVSSSSFKPLVGYTWLDYFSYQLQRKSDIFIRKTNFTPRYFKVGLAAVGAFSLFGFLGKKFGLWDYFFGSKKPVPQPYGFHNEGNTCYIGATLTTIMNCFSFRKTLENINSEDNIIKELKKIHETMKKYPNGATLHIAKFCKAYGHNGKQGDDGEVLDQITNLLNSPKRNFHINDLNAGTIQKYLSSQKGKPYVLLQVSRADYKIINGQFCSLKNCCLCEIPQKYGEFQLKGFNVHHGPVSQNGHYSSFIKTNNDKWYKVDDEFRKEVNDETIREYLKKNKNGEDRIIPTPTLLLYEKN